MQIGSNFLALHAFPLVSAQIWAVREAIHHDGADVAGGTMQLFHETAGVFICRNYPPVRPRSLHLYPRVQERYHE